MTEIYVDTTEFDSMPVEEKLKIGAQLVGIQLLLEAKAVYLKNNKPKWWQFKRKRRYADACAAWQKAAHEYNKLAQAYNNAMVFEDVSHATNKSEQSKENI